MQKKDNPSYVERSYKKQREIVLDMVAKKHTRETITRIREKLGIPINGLRIEYKQFINDQINKIPTLLSHESFREVTASATALCSEEFNGKALYIENYKEMVACYIILGDIPIEPSLDHRSAVFTKMIINEKGNPEIEYSDDVYKNSMTVSELVQSFPFGIHFNENISQRELINFIKMNWPPNKHLLNQWGLEIKHIREKTRREVDNYIADSKNQGKSSKQLADEVSEKFGVNYIYQDIDARLKKIRDRQE